MWADPHSGYERLENMEFRCLREEGCPNTKRNIHTHTHTDTPAQTELRVTLIYNAIMLNNINMIQVLLSQTLKIVSH